MAMIKPSDSLGENKQTKRKEFKFSLNLASN